MLTFLRRIRKSLIESGSTRKYLLYAVGEILLVMIGILLALQVNNWNEKRIDLKFERLYLQEILENLYADKAQIRQILNFQEELMKATIKSLEIIQEGNDDRIKFDTLFDYATRYNPTFFPKVGGYKSLITQRGPRS